MAAAVNPMARLLIALKTKPMAIPITLKARRKPREPHLIIVPNMARTARSWFGSITAAAPLPPMVIPSLGDRIHQRWEPRGKLWTNVEEPADKIVRLKYRTARHKNMILRFSFTPLARPAASISLMSGRPLDDINHRDGT